MNGAPGVAGGLESGFSLPRKLPALGAIKPRRRWGTRRWRQFYIYIYIYLYLVTGIGLS